MRIKLIVISAIIAIAAAGMSHAEDFYKGKTIRVIVGGSAGGSTGSTDAVTVEPSAPTEQPSTQPSAPSDTGDARAAGYRPCRDCRP